MGACGKEWGMEEEGGHTQRGRDQVGVTPSPHGVGLVQGVGKGLTGGSLSRGTQSSPPCPKIPKFLPI